MSVAADNILTGSLDPSYYKKLKDLHDLKVSSKSTAKDWFEYNQTIQKIAEQAAPQKRELNSFEYERMASGKAASASIKEIIEGMIYVGGKHMSYSGPWKFQLGFTNTYAKYAHGAKNVILNCSRQVGKSTAQVAKSAALGIVFPYYNSLYVTGRYKQVVVFSQQRFKPMLEASPDLMGSYIQPSRYLWQVMARQFANGSLYNFRSCFRDADGARGISANCLMIDEIQDIVSDVVGVLEQCQSQSPKEITHRLYAGTPKTTSSTIHRYWENSCQFEWLTKCQGCGEYNYSDQRIIKPTHYECVRCAKQIYPKQHGTWVPAHPDLLDVRWGFRVPQIISPAKEAPDLYADMTSPTMSQKEFYNEVLGLPYDVGQVGLTDTLLRQKCKNYRMHTIAEVRQNYAYRNQPLFAGVDYGTGEGSNPSYTVLVIGTGTHTGVFKLLYAKKFMGNEINEYEQPKLINQICRDAGVLWLGADSGYGIDKNLRLENEFGWNRHTSGPGSLLEFTYVTSGKEATWTDKRYHVNRTESMTQMIQAVQGVRGKLLIDLFCYEDLAVIRRDLTAPVLEYNDKTGKSKYVHTTPDDGFHALNYAYLAFRQYNNDLVSSSLPSLS